MSGTDGKLPLEDRISLETCSFLAIVLPFIFAVLWICSAFIDGDWTFGKDSLSRMGISESAVSALLFNGGCIITGAMGVLVGYGTAVHERGYNTYAGAAYALGMLFLMFVGIFPMDLGTIHYVVASAFGILILVAVIFFAVTDHRQDWHPEIDIIIIVASAVLVATQEFEMWEPLLVIFVMVFTVIHGIKMRLFHDAFPLSIKN